MDSFVLQNLIYSFEVKSVAIFLTETKLKNDRVSKIFTRKIYNMTEKPDKKQLSLQLKKLKRDDG